jgi:addiction module RelB/DinJ family antitoxin
MAKSSTIRARIEPDLKVKAEHIFQQLGLTTTQAITLFYKQVELKKGCLLTSPFLTRSLARRLPTWMLDVT